MTSNRPLVTLAIVFYNQERFVEDAVKGALSQTYDNLEIVLSDDCSSDGTFEQIEKCTKEYHGPHRIVINKNENNIGLVPHMNKIIYELSKGKFIFLTGGDDVSLPNRVEDGVDYFDSNPDLSMVTFSTIYINENGDRIGGHFEKEDFLIKINDKGYLGSDSFMAGLSGQAFRKDILEEYGPMGDCQTEDSVLRFRSIMKGPVLVSSRIGLKYRIHSNNISASSRIYRLFDTDRIAAQYKKDLLVQKSFLDFSLYKLIERKIEYYIKFRKISVKQSRKDMNVSVRFFYRCVHFLMRKNHERRVRNYSKSL